MLLEIENLNINLFNPCRLKIAYRTNCLTSWIQIDIIDYSTINSTGIASKENELVSIENSNDKDNDSK